MKALDDSKTVELNKLIEERFKQEQLEWGEKITTLIKQTGDTSKLAECQVFQLSYRQQLQEKLVEHRMTLDKRYEVYDKQKVQRFREYTTHYDIKLSSSEKTAFIDADCSAIKRQIRMFEREIQFLEECVKTLDNLGFAIKNKIEIVSQQLM